MAGGNNFLNWNTYPGVGTNGVPGQVSNTSAFPSSTTSGWGNNVLTGASNPYATTGFSGANSGTSTLFSMLGLGTSSPATTSTSNLSVGQQATSFVTSGMNSFLYMLGLGTSSATPSSQTNTGTQFRNELGWGNGIFNAPGVSDGPFSRMTEANSGTTYNSL